MSAQSELSLMRDEQYVSAWNKLMELKDELIQVEENLRELNQKGPNDAFKANLERKVDAVLSGRDPDTLEPSDWHGDMRKSRERKRLLSLAEEKQARIVGRERSRASREIAQRVRPQYVGIIRELARLLIPVGDAIIKEAKLRSELVAAEVWFQGTMPPVPLRALGDPRSKYSDIARWFQEVLREAYISEEDIPKSWREKWGESWRG